jgi:hypothetical protein
MILWKNYMKLIIRSAGERTEKICEKLASEQGEVHVIKEFPFGNAIKKTYKLAQKFDQKWIPVIDADVQLYPGVIEKAIAELNQIKDKKIFCLDGKTDDKIFMQNRRAGIHIYRIDYLAMAAQFIDNTHIKPESNIRRKMSELGYHTHVGKIVFGKHDYDQYYCDLWRKAVCQTQKLAKKIRNKPTMWKNMSKKDKDFLVIYRAHYYGRQHRCKITIDKRIDFDAAKNIQKLGLKEKGEMI